MARKTIAELERDLEVSKRETALLRADYEQYRVAVREEAIKAQESEGWCDEGLNGALDRLGLEPKLYKFDVLVNVTMQRTVVVEADNEDSAGDTIHGWSAAERRDKLGVPASLSTWDYEIDTIDTHYDE